MAKRSAVKREARERRHGGEVPAPRLNAFRVTSFFTVASIVTWLLQDKMIFKSALAMGMVGEAEMMDAHKGGSGIRIPGQHGRIESKLDMSDLEVLYHY